MQFRSTE